MPTAVKGWKFLVVKDGKITSNHDANRSPVFRTTWEIGEWKNEPGYIRACQNGFHHSDNPYDAFTYVSGSVLARVEVKGTRVSDPYPDANHKEACSDMRIVKAGAWGKNDSVGLALHAAGLAAAMLPAGNECRKLAERGMAAVRGYLANGTKVDEKLLFDLRDCQWTGSRINGIDPAAVTCPVWYAGYATTEHVSSDYAGTHAIYAVSNTIDLIDGYEGHKVGAVKAAVNTWMENRFKTLPRF